MVKRFQHATQKKPAKIIFSPNIYKMPVKMHHWEYNILAQKKDNDVYRDHLSNMMSTYNRFGTEDIGCHLTETRHMLEQCHDRKNPIYPFKPLVNFTSYPCTDTPGRNRLMKSADLAQLPPDFGKMDYLTSHQDDYRNPYPRPLRPLTMPSTPFLLNRVICSDRTQNYSTAPPKGEYQCLDTHTPIAHIRRMRLYRYQSFDPSTCLQNFPNVAIPDDPDFNKPFLRKY